MAVAHRTSPLARFTLLILTLLGLAGCQAEDYEGVFVDGELGEELREVLHQLVYAEWTDDQGTTRLDFQYRYGLGLEDPEGIAAVSWSYGLVSRDGYAVTDFVHEQMRDPEPEKARLFVTGRRTRALSLPTRKLIKGTDYVMFFRLCYRGSILGEYLTPVTAGEPFVLDAGALPDLPPERIGEPLSCELPLPPLAPSDPQLISGR